MGERVSPRAWLGGWEGVCENGWVGKWVGMTKCG